MEIRQEIWGMTQEGEPIIRYTMINSHGESIALCNYGATLLEVNVRDREGVVGDVTLGYREWQDYQQDGPFMGKSVGRFANRIARGKFSINDTVYRLAINNGPNALHGGPTGPHNRVWGARVEGNRVVFNYLSPDGQEGYPGELTMEVCYDWDDSANLAITYFARSEADTVVNLTSHAYFNLDGHDAGSILDHTLQLNCHKWLPTDSTQIPTGELADVASTPMDFLEPHTIGERIREDYEPLKIGNGYDHCWAIDGYTDGHSILPVGELYSPKSGRRMKIATSQPGVQIYSGNWLSGCPLGKGGVEYIDNAGVALECQAFPDSPNKPEFPSTLLLAGEVYEQAIIYTFSAE